ncbi:collagen-like triple helix repeat-containing protein [Aquimarina algiphila]|uniref:collagen-like triple helix repeat-containing protein n=1 Tax=Aquimarina algiphila TaxID=2047982 RepID=UPI00232B8119|nr:collagen-like protein [Aquimarina algiphila]
MKTKKVKSQYIFLILIVLFTFSCSDGEDGAIGPAGPQGEQGVNGQNGQDGNANVVSILLEDQTISNGDTVFDIPELTQEIFDSGFVFAYVTVTGNDYWETLPLSLGQDIILEIDQIEVGKVTLRSTFTQSNLRLRFILVESSSNVNGINFPSFQEVKEHYDLKN